MNTVSNVRKGSNTNPNTAVVTDVVLFTTVIKNINKNVEYMTGGPIPKPYYIGTIDYNGKLLSCRIPGKVVDTIAVGDQVNVSATKLDTITALTVIGNASIGNAADVVVFDELFAEADKPAVQAGEVEKVGA